MCWMDLHMPFRYGSWKLFWILEKCWVRRKTQSLLVLDVKIGEELQRYPINTSFDLSLYLGLIVLCIQASLLLVIKRFLLMWHS